MQTETNDRLTAAAPELLRTLAKWTPLGAQRAGSRRPLAE